jgi:hypothetical protein
MDIVHESGYHDEAPQGYGKMPTLLVPKHDTRKEFENGPVAGPVAIWEKRFSASSRFGGEKPGIRPSAPNSEAKRPRPERFRGYFPKLVGFAVSLSVKQYP